MSLIVTIKATFNQLAAPPVRQLPAVTTDTVNDGVIYTPIPKYFTDPKTWPQSCNLHCWVCDQVPIGFPRFAVSGKFKVESDVWVYTVRGVFHDWSCAARYIKTEHPHEDAEMLALLTEVEAMFSGRRRINMVESASKYVMKKYIGDTNGITVDQWNKMNETKIAENTLYADNY